MMLRHIPKLAYSTLRADLGYHDREMFSREGGRKIRSLWPSLERPIFLVGAPRSGTTFLGSCVGALSSVSYHFEPILTKAAAKRVYESSLPGFFLSMLYRSTYRWLMRVNLDAGLRFAEKTPRNCFLMPFLARTFTDAQFIHIIRDGRDVALSYSEKPWLSERALNTEKREPGGYRYGPYPRFWVEPDRRDEFRTTSDIHRCIWAWRRHVTAARSAGQKLSKDRYLECRYENVVDSPMREADRVSSFLGSVTDAEEERLHEHVRTVHAGSRGRWKIDLQMKDLATIKMEAGPLLRDLCYIEDT